MDCKNFEIFKEDDSKIIYKNYLDLEDERVPNLGESLEECHLAFRLLTWNQFNKGLKICDKWSKQSLYHMHIKSLFHFLKAILTLEKPEIDRATMICEQALKFCQTIRRSGAFSSLSKMISKPDYNSYSEEEVHAELIYAEQQLMIALITFFGDQSIVSLVKGALRIRSFCLRECMTIVESRTQWQSDSTRMHFESGTRMGIGSLNLVLSHLPQRVLRLLEFMGFSGSKQIGLDELNKTADNDNGLRHFLAKLMICAYECYMEQIFGLGRGDLTRVEQIVDKELKKFDKSAWFLWFKARILQMRGQTENAIPVLEECLTVQSELRQLHNICFWELLWCHAVKCEWDSAAKYASILGRQCHWSPATFAYQEATFLFMKMVEEDNHEIEVNVIKLLRSVPTLRIRYAGKTIPPEKYCIVRAEKYSQRRDLMILPAFELFYIWNIFSLVSNNQNLIKPMIRRIDKNLEKFQTKDYQMPGDESLESHLMLLFMKGVCLKELGLYSEAQVFFERILKVENQIKDDTFLPPEAALELGLCKLAMGCPKQAKHWLEKARKDYTGYQLETIIHFRVHCALQIIKNDNGMIK